MSALLDTSKGFAAIAYVGETPWHHQGQKIDADAPLEQWVIEAGLDWEALKLGSAFKNEDGTYQDIPGRVTLVRSDTRAYLGQFTDLYVPAQPADILAFFRDFILVDDRFKLETAGSLRGGRVIWALARFREDKLLFGKEHERHAQYVFLTTSFDGSLATTAQATVVRVVCNNTLTASIFSPSSATFRLRHNAEFKGVIAEDAANQLASIAATYERYGALAEALNGVKVTRDQTRDFFENLLPSKKFDQKTKEQTERSKRSREKMLGQFYTLLDKTVREGAEPGSAWTLYNAATDFADHARGVKKTIVGETDNTARMYSNLLGGAAREKGKALSDIFDLTGLNMKEYVGQTDVDVTDGELLAA